MQNDFLQKMNAAIGRDPRGEVLVFKLVDDDAVLDAKLAANQLLLWNVISGYAIGNGKIVIFPR